MLSKRITFLRKTLGMSQLELAQKLHISPSAEGMYEQGRRTPNLELLTQMSRIFGVSLDYLITGKEFKSDEDQPERKNIESCPCCPCCCRNKGVW